MLLIAIKIILVGYILYDFNSSLYKCGEFYDNNHENYDYTLSIIPFNDSVKAVFESHKIVGKELDKDILSVYVIGYVMGVYDDNQRFGGEFPARIQIQKAESGYKAIGYRDALASMDVYDFMPKKYAKAILNYNTSSLSKTVEKQTEDWLKNNQLN